MLSILVEVIFMKKNKAWKLFASIGNIDDRYVKEAGEKAPKKSERNRWFGLGALAVASFAL